MRRGPDPVKLALVDVIRRIAEQRIQEAMERGEFDRLPGAGRPLRLDDDTGVPPELRMVYRVLKNAGFVPPELALIRDIGVAKRRLQAASAPASERRDAWRRLEALKLRLETVRGRPLSPALEEVYCRRLVDRLGRTERDGAGDAAED